MSSKPIGIYTLTAISLELTTSKLKTGNLQTVNLRKDSHNLQETWDPPFDQTQFNLQPWNPLWYLTLNTVRMDFMSRNLLLSLSLGTTCNKLKEVIISDLWQVDQHLKRIKGNWKRHSAQAQHSNLLREVRTIKDLGLPCLPVQSSLFNITNSKWQGHSYLQPYFKEIGQSIPIMLKMSHYITS